MRFDSTMTSTKSRLILLLSGSLIILSLAAASPAAAVTCTVKNPPLSGPNNFSTIQAALAQANCTTINVKNGSYTGPISISRNVELKGQSTAGTIINLAGNILPLEAIVTIQAPATAVTLDTFTIAGPGASGCGSLQFGVYVRDNVNATIKNNRVTAIRDQPLSGCQNGNAIQVGRNSLNTIGRATIQKNTIDDYQKTGIIVDGLLSGPVSTATIIENTIKGDVNGACFPNFRCAPIAAQNGIQISRKAIATVTNNTITDNRYDPDVASSGGILVFGAGDNLLIKGNTADRNDVGVWLIDTNNADVLTNKVRNSTFDGVAVDGGVFNLLGSNTADSNGNGVGLYDTTNNTVEKNSVNTSDGPGIFVDPTSVDNFLSSNKLKKNLTVGIEDQSAGLGTGGTANSYNGNTCTQNGIAPSDPPGLC